MISMLTWRTFGIKPPSTEMPVGDCRRRFQGGPKKTARYPGVALRLPRADMHHAVGVPEAHLPVIRPGGNTSRETLNFIP